LNRAQHARLARALIAKCGENDSRADLDVAAAECRIGKSQLSDCQCPNGVAYMPADVIADLESYCGVPIYSSALAGLFDAPKAQGNLHDACCEVTESAAKLQASVRQAQADGALTPREHDDIAKVIGAVEATLEEAKAVQRAMEANPRTLKAV